MGSSENQFKDDANIRMTCHQPSLSYVYQMPHNVINVFLSPNFQQRAMKKIFRSRGAIIWIRQSEARSQGNWKCYETY